MISRTLPLLFVLTGLAAAQTVTLSAPVPSIVLAQSGASLQSATLPAGPLPAMSSFSALAAPDTSSILQWSSGGGDVAMRLVASLRCEVGAAGGASSVLPGELLMNVSLPTPTAVNLWLSPGVFGVASQAQARVDVGNDGSWEATEASPSVVILSMTIGPVPTPIRVKLSAVLLAPGTVDASVGVSVLPDSQTLVTQAYSGCQMAPFEVLPTFAGDLYHYTTETLSSFGVAVFGLSLQPLPLGSAPWGSCLLLPSTDLLVLAPAWVGQTLTIPPAARPISFWAQAVMVIDGVGGSFSLNPTNALQIVAL